jgi:hypothetical protein
MVARDSRFSGTAVLSKAPIRVYKSTDHYQVQRSDQAQHEPLHTHRRLSASSACQVKVLCFPCLDVIRVPCARDIVHPKTLPCDQQDSNSTLPVPLTPKCAPQVRQQKITTMIATQRNTTQRNVQPANDNDSDDVSTMNAATPLNDDGAADGTD